MALRFLVKASGEKALNFPRQGEDGGEETTIIRRR